MPDQKSSFFVSYKGKQLGVLTTLMAEPELLELFDNIEDLSLGVISADAPVKKVLEE